MSVVVRSREEARRAIARSLEVLSEIGLMDDGTLIAQSLRRAIVFLAPCSHAALIQAVATSLRPIMITDPVDLKELIGEVLDDLCAVGDVLELSPPDADGLTKRQHLWSAPPSFVLTPGDRTYLLGSKGDSITYIPDEFRADVKYSQSVRFITKSDKELGEILAEYGLFPMTAQEWVRRPSATNPEEFLMKPLAKLSRQRDQIEELTLLSGSGRYYRSRWQPLTIKSDGVFIAKRPQRFGGDRWCLVETSNGHVTNLCDIIGTHSRERACDRAWMLHHAIAAKNGIPEHFQIRAEGSQLKLSLFFPIPNWAEKYILLMAEKVEAHDALMSFDFAESSKEHLLELLEKGLWMARLKN